MNTDVRLIRVVHAEDDALHKHREQMSCEFRRSRGEYDERGEPQQTD